MMNDINVSGLSKVCLGGDSMNILVCDDEPSFCNKVSESVTAWFSEHEINANCAVFNDPSQVLAAAELNSFQIAFLDVEMEPLNGIELGKILKQASPDILIIYISAYLEFAIDGYSVKAFRYILKRDFDFSLPACLTAALQELSSNKRFFTFKQHNKLCNIFYDDIFYFESDLRKIHLWGSNPNECLGSFYDKLSSFVPQLEPLGFLQTGRSYLVNMRHIKQIVNYTVLLENGISLNASRSNYSIIQQKYLDWKGAF